MKIKKEVKGWDYLCLALYAFLGFGSEALLAYVIEPLVYGNTINEWTTIQIITHWISISIIWGLVFYCLVKLSSKKYNFDLFAKVEPMKKMQWLLVSICVVFVFVLKYIDWNGFKVLKEFIAWGTLKFVFLYIYYAFETALFMLIIIFGQKAFEVWFKDKKIPYGGIAVAFTWGLGHAFTKGNIMTGILAALAGFVFGVTYLLVNRDIRKTYILLFIMFVF